jgi:lysophospholipase L1-like esterase
MVSWRRWNFASLPGAARPASAFVPVTQDRDWPIYDWAKRHAAVTKLVNDRKPTLVFIGDSITQMFGGEPHDRPQPGREVWEKYYGKRNAANLGFGYDYTENLLWRIEQGELDGAAAKVVVVLIGTNNTGKNSAGDIAGAIRAICDLIRKKQPQTKILLLGILPRSAKPDASRAKIAEINQLISRYDGHNGVTFFDAGGKFISADGTISKELMYDFLHPTAKGYEVLAAAIEPTLAKLLGEAAP